VKFDVRELRKVEGFSDRGEVGGDGRERFII
jgi:hypothetical protein